MYFAHLLQCPGLRRTPETNQPGRPIPAGGNQGGTADARGSKAWVRCFLQRPSGVCGSGTCMVSRQGTLEAVGPPTLHLSEMEK